MGHTRPDPCRWYHGRTKCDPSIGFSWLKSIAANCLQTICLQTTNLKNYLQTIYKLLTSNLLTRLVFVVVCSIVVDGAFTRVLFHSVTCESKAARMNAQRWLILELKLNEFELSHNPSKATPNICCTKVKGAFDHKQRNQMIEDIVIGLHEPRQSSKVI